LTALPQALARRVAAEFPRWPAARLGRSGAPVRLMREICATAAMSGTYCLYIVFWRFHEKN